MNFYRNQNESVKLRHHYVTDIKMDRYSGQELRMPFNKLGMEHSMIYAGTCGRTGYPVVIDQDHSHSPAFRRIEKFTKKALYWGDQPSFPAERVLESSTTEVFKKYGSKLSYDFLKDNCQHFVSRHQHGISQSRQINQAVCLGLGALLAARYLTRGDYKG